MNYRKKFKKYRDEGWSLEKKWATQDGKWTNEEWYKLKKYQRNKWVGAFIFIFIMLVVVILSVLSISLRNFWF